MGWLRAVFQLSVVIGLIAVFLTLPILNSFRQQLVAMFSVCPIHWFSSKASLGETRRDDQGVIRLGTDDKLFTYDELRQLDGAEDSSGLCVAVLGSVYDVSSGRKHYGLGGSYSFFAGWYGH